MEEGVYLGANNPNLPHTDFGWEIDPFGFRATIREMYSRYRFTNDCYRKWVRCL